MATNGAAAICGGSGSLRTPRDPQAHLERTHWTRLLLVYLPLEALLSPLHLAFCAAFLQPWVALKDVLYFVKELVKAVLLLCSWRIGLWEALCNVAKAFVALPSTGAQWGALLLVLVARVLAMYTRYRCSFGAMGRRPGVLFVLVLGHAAAGLLMSVAFLLRADKPGTGLRLPHHHSAALLAGVGSALADALLVFYRRGLQSSRGQGRFRLPPPPDGHRLLARGFDQGLFEVRHFTRDDDGGARRRRSNRRSSIEGGGAGGAGGLPVPRYARMLFPPLPDPPHDLPFFIKPTAPAWAKTLGRVVFKRAWLLLEASEALACLARAVATCVAVAGAVYPFEALLRALAALTWSPEWLTDALKEEGVVGTLTQLGVLYKVASTALSLSLAVYSGLALSTLLLYHILAQPVDFGNFASTTGPVLQHWLEKGWTVALRDARRSTPSRRRRQGEELGEDELWRAALEDSQRVLHRVAVLGTSSTRSSSKAAASFPPQVRAPEERRLSVADRLYRAHAFMDLAILAHADSCRRREVFRDLRAWNEHCRPCLAVINALALQLELQIEAGARVAGGAVSPLAGLHARLGLGAEPRDAHFIAWLMVEAQVQQRVEKVLAARGRWLGVFVVGGGGGSSSVGGGAVVDASLLMEGRAKEATGEIAAAAAAAGGSLPLLPKGALAPLSLPLLELQVAENAALALAALYQQAVATDRATGAFEDSRGAARHSIPAVLAALLSCQLAIHLYSGVALQQDDAQGGQEADANGGGKKTGAAAVRFTVMRDRPSVVLPQLCDVSAAVDRAIERIVVGFYDSDFASFAFAPLYARLIKIYVQQLRENEVTVQHEDEDDDDLGGSGYLQRGGMLSPGASSPPRRRK